MLSTVPAAPQTLLINDRHGIQAKRIFVRKTPHIPTQIALPFALHPAITLPHWALAARHGGWILKASKRVGVGGHLRACKAFWSHSPTQADRHHTGTIGAGRGVPRTALGAPELLRGWSEGWARPSSQGTGTYTGWLLMHSFPNHHPTHSTERASSSWVCHKRVSSELLAVTW